MMPTFPSMYISKGYASFTKPFIFNWLILLAQRLHCLFQPATAIARGDDKPDMTAITPTLSARMMGEARTAGTMPVHSSQTAEKKAEGTSNTDSAEGGSFMDALKGFIDIINPLQHLPVIGTLYRKITGDEMSPIARLAGDALFGGPIGAALAMVDIAVESHTGKDVGATMLAMVDGKDKSKSNSETLPAGMQHANVMLAAAQEQQNFPRSPTPTGMAMQGNTQPAHSYKPAVPVDDLKNGRTIMAAPTPASEAGALKRSFASSMDSTSVLTSQDAPDGTGRRPAPPELIASRMEEGLDKYRAMMTARTKPGIVKVS